MKAFIWDKHFITGLETVDEQHQHLVGTINEFGEYLTNNEQVSLAVINEIFAKLTHYAEYHFSEEEKLMKEINVDARHIQHHISEHQRFLKEVVGMHGLITDENTDAASSLLKFLTHWLAFHILGEDQLMAKQIDLIERGLSPRGAYEEISRMEEGATQPLLVALNGLFHQVSERNKRLVELNCTLEQKVEERTQELHKANLHLKELAHTDLLTGLPNRRHAMQFIETAWENACAFERALVCIMIDADGFKQVNDQHGHDAGDCVLRELSKCLQNSFRTDDFVSRLGGDEFMVVLQNTSIDGARNIAELVRSIVSEMKVQAGDGGWTGSVSMGVAERTANMPNYDALIKAADLAVYQAKNNGRNRVEYFMD